MFESDLFECTTTSLSCTKTHPPTEEQNSSGTGGVGQLTTCTGCSGIYSVAIILLIAVQMLCLNDGKGA